MMQATELIKKLPDLGEVSMSTAIDKYHGLIVQVNKDSLAVSLAELVKQRGDFELPVYIHYTNINGANKAYIG